MFEIEYGADYSDSYVIYDNDWDRAMGALSRGLAYHVDRRLISVEEFEQGMEWTTGVVVEDEGVRVSGIFGGLTVAITLMGGDDLACDRCSRDLTEEQCIASLRRAGVIWCEECETLA